MPVLRFLGHSACEVRDGDTRVLIDPYLNGNPAAAVSADEVNPTAILITHAHNDHLGDSQEIAKRTGALVVSTFEIATWFEYQGFNAHGLCIGGAYTFPWGWVKLTQAWHSSTWEDGQGGMLTLGTPSGILLRIGGKLLYHAGDTGLFGDMALIGRHGVDLALLPIGDNYTMGPEDALEAVRLIQPKAVVPIHYNTFPVIEQDPHPWVAKVTAETGIPATVLESGGEIEF